MSATQAKCRSFKELTSGALVSDLLSEKRQKRVPLPKSSFLMRLELADFRSLDGRMLTVWGISSTRSMSEFQVAVEDSVIFKPFLSSFAGFLKAVPRAR